MDEKDFELLTDLAHTCNLTKTAQRFFLTQSALTKRVQKLEEELGATFFLRTKKGLVPTPVMEQLLPHLHTITDSIEQMRNLCASQDGAVAGTLTLGVSSNYARYRLPAVLEEYMALYPMVDINLNSHRSPTLYRLLMEGSLSAAIIRGEYAWKEGDEILSEEPLCLVKSIEHEDTPLEELPYIARETDPDLLATISAWRTEKGITPTRSDLAISDVPTVITLVERGMGWSILPAICLDDFHGIISPLYQDDEPITRRTHFLYREGHLSLPQLSAFLEIAKKHE
ncbi:MAG: LysR family transcriptional regulator [Blautia sp.]|nr:LysR family transcriptional regulator [Blautia sp.]